MGRHHHWRLFLFQSEYLIIPYYMGIYKLIVSKENLFRQIKITNHYSNCNLFSKKQHNIVIDKRIISNGHKLSKQNPSLPINLYPQAAGNTFTILNEITIKTLSETKHNGRLAGNVAPKAIGATM